MPDIKFVGDTILLRNLERKNVFQTKQGDVYVKISKTPVNGRIVCFCYKISEICKLNADLEVKILPKIEIKVYADPIKDETQETTPVDTEENRVIRYDGVGLALACSVPIQEIVKLIELADKLKRVHYFWYSNNGIYADKYYYAQHNIGEWTQKNGFEDWHFNLEKDCEVRICRNETWYTVPRH